MAARAMRNQSLVAAIDLMFKYPPSIMGVFLDLIKTIT